MKIEVVGDAAPWLGDITHTPFQVAKHATEVRVCARAAA
jgi:hypothetical protein